MQQSLFNKYCMSVLPPVYFLSDQVEELPENVSKTVAAEWNTHTAGGSHVHPDWKNNPCFHLKMRSLGPAKVISLTGARKGTVHDIIILPALHKCHVSSSRIICETRRAWEQQSSTNSGLPRVTSRGNVSSEYCHLARQIGECLAHPVRKSTTARIARQ